MASVSYDLYPTTELEAVNLCLSAIGEQPVNSVTTNGMPDVASAVDKLRSASRFIQSRGCSFNRVRIKLQRAADNTIPVPSDTLDLNLAHGEYSRGVQRGDKLFNLTTNSFTWDRDVQCEVTQFLPFDQLPEHARHYVTVRAAREFVRAQLLTQEGEKVTADDEKLAMIEFRRQETRAKRLNVLRTDSVRGAFDRSPFHAYVPLR